MSQIQSTSDGRVLVLTLRYPSSPLVSRQSMYAAGTEALNVAADSGDVACVVIDARTASGPPWTAPVLDADARSALIDNLDLLHGWVEELRTFPKPVIAAIEDSAAGEILAVALGSDFVVSARNAMFQAGVSDIGLPAAGGVAHHLAKVLPRQLCNDMLVLGNGRSAEQLQHWGLINRLCDPGGALDGALALGRSLAQHTEPWLAASKELLSDAVGLHASLQVERRHWLSMLSRSELLRTLSPGFA